MHLAIHNQAGAVPLAEISVCQNISMSYVDQIFWKLRRAGLVRGTPGPGGGYRLGRAAESISIAEVITLMDSDGSRQRSSSELDQAVWRDLSSRIEAFLSGITIADFAARPEIRAALERQYAGSQWRCDVCGALATRTQPPGMNPPA
mgnify:CR=1 FL=1